jgi:hypothetical protein
MRKGVQNLHLDHLEPERLALSHASCNLRAGAKKAAAIRRAKTAASYKSARAAGIAPRPQVSRRDPTPLRSPPNPSHWNDGGENEWTGLRHDCTEVTGHRIYKRTHGATPDAPLRVPIVILCTHPGEPHHNGRCWPNLGMYDFTNAERFIPDHPMGKPYPGAGS